MAANALSREADRLDALVKSYRSNASRTSIVEVKAMADEGAAATVERMNMLRGLSMKLRGDPPGPEKKP